eukprot:TRINITY_DN6445_c0_g1_i2.p1 TRINITY_DN6445_c0_g1~~TRINITY_DN6445_c0_g1_i2.p1  ORF type:complete len:306 (+),score=107.83 TRINITY_DN6445_c0_g1_i2:54-971(+)
MKSCVAALLCAILGLAAANQRGDAFAARCQWLKHELASGKKEWLWKQRWWPKAAEACGIEVFGHKDDRDDSVDDYGSYGSGYGYDGYGYGKEDADDKKDVDQELQLAKKCQKLKEELATGNKEWLVKQEWYPRLAAKCGFQVEHVDDGLRRRCTWLKEKMVAGEKQWLSEQKWYPDLAAKCGFKGVDEGGAWKKRCAWLKEAMDAGKTQWLMEQEWFPALAAKCGHKEEYSADELKKKCVWLNETMAAGKKQWLMEQDWYPDLAAKCGFKLDVDVLKKKEQTNIKGFHESSGVAFEDDTRKTVLV